MRVLQVRAGATGAAMGLAVPPEVKPGYQSGRSAEGTRNYMRRLDDGYREVNGAVVDVMSNRPPKEGAGWTYINDWLLLYGRWRTFYDETIDDWLITTDDDEQSADFGRRLEKARDGYKKALGEKVPGEPVAAKPVEAEEAGPLDGLTTLLKWGVIAYVGVNVGSAILSRSGGK